MFLTSSINRCAQSLKTTQANGFGSMATRRDQARVRAVGGGAIAEPDFHRVRPRLRRAELDAWIVIDQRIAAHEAPARVVDFHVHVLAVGIADAHDLVFHAPGEFDLRLAARAMTNAAA